MFNNDQKDFGPGHRFRFESKDGTKLECYFTYEALKRIPSEPSAIEKFMDAMDIVAWIKWAGNRGLVVDADGLHYGSTGELIPNTTLVNIRS